MNTTTPLTASISEAKAELVYMTDPDLGASEVASAVQDLPAALAAIAQAVKNNDFGAADESARIFAQLAQQVADAAHEIEQWTTALGNKIDRN